MVLARQGIWKGKANHSSTHRGRPGGPAASLPLFNTISVECSHFKASSDHCQLGKKANDGQKHSLCSPRGPTDWKDGLPPSTKEFWGGVATAALCIHGWEISWVRERPGCSQDQERQEDGGLHDDVSRMTVMAAGVHLC